jgi:hypothetical protein
MIRKIARAAVLPALLCVAACSSQSSSAHPAAEAGFPVEGSSGDLRRLTGRWEGDYSSTATGRSGSIVFEFKAGELAYGDVLMMPKSTSQAIPQVLTIRFAQTAGGAITGDLAPYQDPDCSCEVTTTFVGTFDKSGTKISGMFTSTQTREGGRRVSGNWSVAKSARKPETVS